MIPQIIHCVWLSGDTKPQIYADCIQSWHLTMPEFEIKEWSINNLPENVLNCPFVSGAMKAKKWAYATDYIRLWALHTYGGIYMDMDVMVFKSFTPFINHRFFSSIELDPRYLYNSISNKKRKEIIGLGIEAAVMGAEKEHPFIKDALDLYKHLKFINTPEFCFEHIMPRMLTRTAKSLYGFKLIPNYQILRDDMHLYPCDVFSSVYDWHTIGYDSFDEALVNLKSNPIRYSCHLCAHAWYEGTVNYHTFKWKIKHFIYVITLAKYWKKKRKVII